MTVEGGICLKAVRLLEETTEYVTQPEALGEELIVAKLKFRSMIQAYQSQQESARARLGALQEPVRRCLAANNEGVAEAVNAAWTLEYECQEILKLSKDADAFRTAVESLEASIAEAETTVKNTADTLKKREAEAIERRAIQARFDTLQQEVVEASANLKKLVKQELGPGESTFPMAVERLQQKFGKKRREEFRNRFGMCDNAPAAAPVDEPLMGPEEFISASGLHEHEEHLMELHDVIEALKDEAKLDLHF